METLVRPNAGDPSEDRARERFDRVERRGRDAST